MTHLILRQNVELTLNTAANALHWQNAIVRLCETSLPDLLNNLFSNMHNSNNMLVIDKLELNLGEISEVNFEEEFTQRLLIALRENIEQITPAKPLQTDTTTAPLPMLLQSFLHFLNTGTLPWWETATSGFSIPEEAVLHLLTNQPQLIAQVAAALQSRAAQKRLALQFSPPFWSSVMQLISPHIHRQGLQMLPLLPALPYPLQEAHLFWRRWVTTLLVNNNAAGLTLNQLAALFLQTLPMANSLLLPENLQNIIAQSGLKELTVAEIQHFANQNNQKEESPVQLPVELPEKEIFIQNAGLVLLAPFIPRFLEVCGVAENNRLLYPQKAVHLLQLLVTGEIQTPEFELPLNKLLCAVAQEEPLALSATISSAEIEEAANLLQSVIQHWSVLKNTSVEGLRKNFLQRNGKLIRQPDESSRLQVEKESFDMVLEHIPWTYSVVGLPWMPHPLWVDW